LAVTSAWVQSESASFPGGNGLGTTLQLPGATPDPSNNKVYDYTSLAQGLQAADLMLAGGTFTGADGQQHQQQALAPQFVSDLRSGSASEQQLVHDIWESDWGGLGPGGGSSATDANVVAAKLGQSGFSAAGSPSAGSTAASATLTSSPLASIAGAVLGATGITSSIKSIVFTGIAAIAGVALIVLGVHRAGGDGQPKQHSTIVPLSSGAGELPAAAEAAAL
ncbi:MAG: hypothetical protein JWM85_382, partial [Acidimicrobiaceae bacterium]|nr:hypothetical protein [Acidimicrobiaceae bacterium]